MENKIIKEKVCKKFIGTNLNLLKLPNSTFTLTIKQLENIIDFVCKEQQED